MGAVKVELVEELPEGCNKLGVLFGAPPDHITREDGFLLNHGCASCEVRSAHFRVLRVQIGFLDFARTGGAWRRSWFVPATGADRFDRARADDLVLVVVESLRRHGGWPWLDYDSGLEAKVSHTTHCG